MKIPPIVYIIIGLLVAFFSWFLNVKTASSKLTLFLYLGIALFAYGAVRQLILGKPKETVKPTFMPNQQPQYRQICKRCGLQVNVFDNFCSRCGMYLKGRG